MGQTSGGDGGMDHRTVETASTGNVSYDLLSNPFVLLRLPPTATKEEVAEAFVDAIAEAWSDDESLREARRKLLAPKLRLAATVDVLVDATPSQRDIAIDALRDDLSLSTLIGIAKDLPSAARLTFLSNVAQSRPSYGALRFFVLTVPDVDRSELQASVAGLFEEAGLPAPDAGSIWDAFNASTTKSAQRLFSGYRDLKSASLDILRCIDEVISQATGEQMAAFSPLISAYQELTAQVIGDLRHSIYRFTEVFLKDPRALEILDSLQADLRSWSELSRPIQRLSRQKGRDDPHAREVFEHLRSFMISLANEKGAAEAALKLSRTCRETFSELPRAVAQLEEDLETLQNLVDQEAARELFEVVEVIRADLDPLVDDLQRGFSRESVRHAKRLFEAFDSTVVKTKHKDISNLPWVIVRDLALDINNDLGESNASEALISGLINHVGFNEASEQMRAAILGDLRVLRMNAAQVRFKRSLDKKDSAGIRSALESMISHAKDDEERREFRQAISNIDAAKRRSTLQWAFWIAVIIIGIIVMANKGSGSRGSSYSSSGSRTTQSSQVAQTTAASDNREVKPLNSVAPFSRGNLRYCQFESARITAVKDMISNETTQVISRYNDAVADYNRHCSNYKYYEFDLDAVKKEISENSNKINSSAKMMLQDWRK